MKKTTIGAFVIAALLLSPFSIALADTTPVATTPAAGTAASEHMQQMKQKREEIKQKRAEMKKLREEAKQKRLEMRKMHEQMRQEKMSKMQSNMPAATPQAPISQ